MYGVKTCNKHSRAMVIYKSENEARIKLGCPLCGIEKVLKMRRRDLDKAFAKIDKLNKSKIRGG